LLFELCAKAEELKEHRETEALC